MSFFDKIGKELGRFEDRVKDELRNVDDKLNISENKEEWLTFGTLGPAGVFVYPHVKAQQKAREANKLNKQANQTALDLQRNTLYREAQMALTQWQLERAAMEAGAASSGLVGSSGFLQAQNSQRAQVLERFNWQNVMGANEAAIARKTEQAQRKAQGAQRWQQIGTLTTNLAMSAVSMGGGGVAGGMAAGIGGAVTSPTTVATGGFSGGGMRLS